MTKATLLQRQSPSACISISSFSVTIIGGGFSGAAAVIALGRCWPAPLSLEVIEPRRTLGRGLAYGEATSGERLNSRAKDLSLVPENPRDFVDWLTDHHSDDTAPTGFDFARRADYGRYVTERLSECLAKRPELQLRHHRDEAEWIHRDALGRFTVGLGNGRSITSDAVILATGYGCRQASRYGLPAFREIPPERFSRMHRVTLVGTGLTMVDTLFRLRDQGFDGQVTLISRHGQLPQPHTETPSRHRPQWPKTWPESVGDMLRLVRILSQRAEDEGADWQSVFQALRPLTSRLWRELDIGERRRFQRHLATRYGCHRYRLPPAHARRLQNELDSGRTHLARGRVLASDSGQLTVHWHDTDRTSHWPSDLVIDCSGHRPALDTPLLRSLVAAGLARHDALGQGLSVTESGALIQPDGLPSRRLYALGPLGHGSLLEITGAAEIFQQAQTMANEFSTAKSERHRVAR